MCGNVHCKPLASIYSHILKAVSPPLPISARFSFSLKRSAQEYAFYTIMHGRCGLVHQYFQRHNMLVNRSCRIRQCICSVSPGRQSFGLFCAVTVYVFCVKHAWKHLRSTANGAATQSCNRTKSLLPCPGADPHGLVDPRGCRVREQNVRPRPIYRERLSPSTGALPVFNRRNARLAPSQARKTVQSIRQHIVTMLAAFCTGGMENENGR